MQNILKTIDLKGFIATGLISLSLMATSPLAYTEDLPLPGDYMPAHTKPTRSARPAPAPKAEKRAATSRPAAKNRQAKKTGVRKNSRNANARQGKQSVRSGKAVTARSNKAGKPAVTRKAASARTSKKQATALKSTRKAKAVPRKQPVAQPAGKAKRTQTKTNKVKKASTGKTAAKQKK